MSDDIDTDDVILEKAALTDTVRKLEAEFTEFRTDVRDENVKLERKYDRLLEEIQLLAGVVREVLPSYPDEAQLGQLAIDESSLSSASPEIMVILANEDISEEDGAEIGARLQLGGLAGDAAGAALDVADKFIPSRKTITVVWATLSITLMNFGYFTGGYFALNYFQTLHEVDTLNKTLVLWNQKAELMERYPVLEHKLANYSKVSQMLCTISKQPQPKWGFWSSFDFCVSVITTVGYGVLAPQTWYGRLLCILYASAGLPLYIIMLGASGKYVAALFERLDCCKCSNIILELTIKYLNIAIVLGAFLGFYSYFGLQASKAGLTPEHQTSIIEMTQGGDYNVDFTGTKDFVKIGVVEWTVLEVFYYSMISLTTIGFGDFFLAKTNDPSQAFMLFLSVTFGFALFSYAFETYAQASERQIKYFKEKAEQMSAMAAKKSAAVAQRAASRAMSVAGDAMA